MVIWSREQFARNSVHRQTVCLSDSLKPKQSNAVLYAYSLRMFSMRKNLCTELSASNSNTRKQRSVEVIALERIDS